MDDLEPKKLALLRVLQILEKYSDCDHPLKQEDIAKLLVKDFGINIERKAIGRNLALLRAAGYEIETTRAGSFLSSRPFEDSELKMLIDGVLSSRYITAKHSKELIEKLSALSNTYFRTHLKNVYSVNDWSKTDNCAVFYNVEITDEAIARSRQIKFTYNKYGADKKLHATSGNTVSPYQLILHNQRYYLMGYSERWKSVRYYRLDRITDIELLPDEPSTDLRSLEGYKNGINFRELSASRPYMFSDKPQTVEFTADASVCDQVVDWFGYDADIEEEGDKIRVRVCVSPLAMECWAMQYLNHVEIISPAGLREKLAQNLENAIKKYGRNDE